MGYPLMLLACANKHNENIDRVETKLHHLCTGRDLYEFSIAYNDSCKMTKDITHIELSFFIGHNEILSEVGSKS